MAGHGRAPKPRDQRRNGHVPQRGEWVDLEPLDKPILATAERQWAPHVKLLWDAWRWDPVTAQYSVADIAAIYELARGYENFAPNEQRLRMDGLGLTPKGKRDLRWRTPNEVKTIKNAEAKAQVRRLRTVPTQKETG